MFENRLAVVSDIHGNRWALEAVLADLKGRGVGDIVNLGDSFYGPLDPAGTAGLLLPLELPTVRGNEDRLIVEPSAQPEESPTLRFVREGLSAVHLRWLEGLPLTAVVHEGFLMCHGTPEHDDEYLLVAVQEAGIVPRKPEELARRLAKAAHPITLCGHDHVPRTVRLPGGRIIFNPGSVGLPAYTDDTPFRHAMETGTPHARYGIISKSETGWHLEDVAVPYDWESAASAAEMNGRPDWARWLRTGCACVA